MGVAEKTGQKNKDVSEFLDGLDHPLRKEIDLLRLQILIVHNGLNETVKWNGPNYSFNQQDRITMRIHPPKQIQLIFHRGVMKQEQPEAKLIEDPTGLLTWKENDRAFATFKNLAEIEKGKEALGTIIKNWIRATS